MFTTYLDTAPEFAGYGKAQVYLGQVLKERRTIMVVHPGMATVLASLPRREGTLGKMKLSPIAKVLQEELAKA